MGLTISYSLTQSEVDELIALSNGCCEFPSPQAASVVQHRMTHRPLPLFAHSHTRRDRSSLQTLQNARSRQEGAFFLPTHPPLPSPPHPLTSLSLPPSRDSSPLMSF